MDAGQPLRRELGDILQVLAATPRRDPTTWSWGYGTRRSVIFGTEFSARALLKD